VRLPLLMLCRVYRLIQTTLANSRQLPFGHRFLCTLVPLQAAPTHLDLVQAAVHLLLPGRRVLELLLDPLKISEEPSNAGADGLWGMGRKGVVQPTAYFSLHIRFSAHSVPKPSRPSTTGNVTKSHFIFRLSSGGVLPMALRLSAPLVWCASFAANEIQTRNISWVTIIWHASIVH